MVSSGLANAPRARRRKRAGRLLVAVFLLALPAWYGLFVQAPAGPRSLRAFEPDRLAALELDMWQAYYRKERLRLFRDLVVTMREQYRYRWADALGAAFHLARAASTFGDARSDYERVLPDIEAAYTTARDWTGARFDPAAVARAELAWWVARRVPGQNSTEHVGELIAQEYALLYDVGIDRVRPSALLRAQAGYLRDQGGDHADWAKIGSMLQQSYRELAVAVGARP